MRIGAIVTLAGGQAGDQYFRPQPVTEHHERKRVPVWNVAREILGSSLVERASTQLRHIGAASIRVLRDNSSASSFPLQGSKPVSFLAEWESAVDDAVRNGVEQLVLLRIGVYTDVDIVEMLRFHLSTGALLTHACCAEGWLDVAIVSTSALNYPKIAYRTTLSGLIPQQQRFQFKGYINRLGSVREFYQLAQDGLYGRCEMRPAGKEVREGVWVADGAAIDPSVLLSGPVFVGAGSEIAGSCRLTGGCAIERNCKIDYGTLIQESCILDGTYVGVALDVRRSVVAGQKIFHLKRNAEIHIADARMIAPYAKSTSFWGGFGSRVLRAAQQAD